MKHLQRISFPCLEEKRKAASSPVVHHCCPQALSSDGAQSRKGVAFTQERSHPYVTDLQGGLTARTFVIKALNLCRSRALS